MLNHDFKLKPSRYYLALLAVMTVLSVISVLILSIAWWWQLILVLLILGYGWRVLNQQGLLLNSQSICSLSKDEDGQWLINTRANTYSCELAGDSVVTHLASVLRFRALGDQLFLNCVLFPDSLPASEYRQLLVLLRMY